MEAKPDMSNIKNFPKEVPGVPMEDFAMNLKFPVPGLDIEPYTVKDLEKRVSYKRKDYDIKATKRRVKAWDDFKIEVTYNGKKTVWNTQQCEYTNWNKDDFDPDDPYRTLMDANGTGRVNLGCFYDHERENHRPRLEVCVPIVNYKVNTKVLADMFFYWGVCGGYEYGPEEMFDPDFKWPD